MMETNEVSQMLKKILKVDRTGNYRPVKLVRFDETSQWPRARHLSIYVFCCSYFRCLFSDYLLANDTPAWAWYRPLFHDDVQDDVDMWRAADLKDCTKADCGDGPPMVQCGALRRSAMVQSLARLKIRCSKKSIKQLNRVSIWVSLG